LLRNAGPCYDRRSRDETPARQLRGPLDRDCIAQAFQGLDGPLPLAGLLFRVTVIIPRLLITAPRREEGIDDHKYFVGDSQRRLLLADAYCETPKGTAQEGGRLPGPQAHCTKMLRR